MCQDRPVGEPCAVTMTEQSDPSPTESGKRTLRRSPTDRVVVGVAGGLGEYFAIDPVLFRVIFGVTSLFGGAGLLAYVLAWLLIPEPGATDTQFERMVSDLRRRRIPMWLVAVGIGALLWAAALSRWEPGGFVPAVLLFVVLAVWLARRGPAPEPTTADAAGTAGDPTAAPADTLTGATAWTADPVAAPARVVRRSSWRFLAAGMFLLALGVAVVAVIDAIGGVPIPVYLWVALAVVVGTMLAGALFRRVPWLLAVLLPPIIVGLVALGGTDVSMHDGVGERVWRPASQAELSSDYRLAFGQAVLDLRQLPAGGTARTVTVSMAAGELDVVLPADANVLVRAQVRYGRADTPFEVRSGNAITETLAPPATAAGAPLELDISLLDGRVTVRRG